MEDCKEAVHSDSWASLRTKDQQGFLIQLGMKCDVSQKGGSVRYFDSHDRVWKEESKLEIYFVLGTSLRRVPVCTCSVPGIYENVTTMSKICAV